MSHRPDLGYHDEGQDLAAASFYEESIDPVEPVRVLPPAAFRSLTFTLLEDEAVWTRDWVCMGSHEAIPAVGDLLPFTVGTHGIHVQRTETGLVARFNKAQHGGCRMVPLQCQTGAKTSCSFTSCGYSRDRTAIPAGELGDGTPRMHQYLGLRPERLLTAHVRSWGPLIFVNLDTYAPDIEDSLLTLNRAANLFGNYKSVRGAERWMEFRANWKFVGQHLAEGSLAAQDIGEGWVTSHTVLTDGRPARVVWLFPNLVLISTEVETCAIVLQQTAIGQTLCRISVYGNGEVSDAFWHEEIEARAMRAVAEHLDTVRWGTSFRPETVGSPLPLQTHPQGRWLQRTIAERVRRMPRESIETPLFQNPRM